MGQARVCSPQSTAFWEGATQAKGIARQGRGSLNESGDPLLHNDFKASLGYRKPYSEKGTVKGKT